ncbi:hypothetical protein MBLNU457_6256t1 [Dothideomycetes sp. NU457]
MVYDVPRNFIGDSHFAQGQEPQEGDVIELEKGGVLVEVADILAKTDTDLTELLQSRERKSPHKGAHSSSPANLLSPMPSRAFPRSSVAGPSQYQKHKSLTSLLGTPKGRVGKAVLPTKSPFQLRREGREKENWEDGRSPKRRRTEAESSRPTPVVHRKLTEDKLAKLYERSKAKAQQKSAEIINLCSDEVTNTTTETVQPTAESTTATSRRKNSAHEVVQSTDNANKAQKAPRGSSMRADARASGQSTRPPREAEEKTVDTEPSQKKGGSLRLMSNAPRRMLVCQEQLSRRSNSQVRTESASASLVAQQRLAETPRQPAQLEPELPLGESIKKRIARKTRVLSSSPPSPPREFTHQRHIQSPERSAFFAAPPSAIAEDIQPSREASPATVHDKHISQPINISKTPVQQKLPSSKTLPRRPGDPVRRASRSVTPSVEVAPKENIPKIIQTVRANASAAQAETPKADKPSTVLPNDKSMRPPRKPKGPQKHAASLDLNKAANPLQTAMLARPFKQPATETSKAKDPPVDTDRGPWSREALDLFVWRPPDWEERTKKNNEGLTAS